MRARKSRAQVAAWRGYVTRVATIAAVAMAATVGGAASAHAEFGFAPGTSAGTYQADGVTPETQAGATPAFGATDFALNTTLVPYGPFSAPMTDGNLRDAVVDLPPGVVGAITAVPQCKRADVEEGGRSPNSTRYCPASTQVGTVAIDVGNAISPFNSSGVSYFVVPVFNVEPRRGDLASFAFVLEGQGVTNAIARLRPDDHGVRITVKNASRIFSLNRTVFTFWGVPASPMHNALRHRAATGRQEPTLPPLTGPDVPSSVAPKTFLRNPTSCPGTEPVTRFTINSWEDAGTWHTADAPAPPVTGCEKLSFVPTVGVKPTSSRADAPTGLDVDIEIPQTDDPNALATADLKKAVVTLPEGMTINPAGANGLQACTDAQLGLGTDDPLKCPDGAKVASVEAKSPALNETLTGGVYIRSQNSQDPESGEMFRLAMVLENKERGLSIRLPGSITASKATGRLVTTFDDNPQMPVSSIKLSFKSGPRAPLATPSACGPHQIETQLTSWAGHVVNTSSSFNVDCAPGLGGFSPAFSAGTVVPSAGAYAPFRLRIDKPDGQSPLNRVALDLPAGLLAKVKGNLGTQVGTATVAAGPGSSPFVLKGSVVLEGAYGDAPYSLKVTVPAKAGPFDLGNVVVKQKVYVDRKDAHVRVVSDPLPTIVGGVPVRLQNLVVDVDKPGFMVNPTSCDEKTISGVLAASTDQTAGVSARFQVGDCAALQLKPNLDIAFVNTRQLGKGKHPGVEATLRAHEGQANLKQVKVALPLAVALDPDNAKALCAPDGPKKLSCPQESIIGQAHATTPLLNGPLSGPVYFVKGTRTTEKGLVVATLPKLWIPLSGEGIKLDLHADSDAVGPAGKQKLVSTFTNVPDVLVDTFRLKINSGKNGILKATTNVCAATKSTDVEFRGQNGRVTKTTVNGSAPRCKTRIASASANRGRVSVRVQGLKPGRLTVTGSRIRKHARSIKRADVATVKGDVNLTTSQRRTLNRGRNVRLAVRVAYKPTKGKTVTLKRTVTVKGTKR